MNKQYATGFASPVYHEGYPLTFTISISHAIQRPLYFERSYLSAGGEVLAVRASVVSERGVVRLTEFGPVPAGTAAFTACLTTVNNATESTPEAPALPVEEEGPSFATGFEQPVMFGDNPLSLAIGIGSAKQPVYLERTYLDSTKLKIGRRSDLLTDRNALLHFNIHQPAPPAGTRWIEVCIANTSGGTDIPDNPGGITALEYNELEYNDLEYN